VFLPLLGFALPIPPDRYVAHTNFQATQDQTAGTIAQPQGPQHNDKQPQPFGLIRLGIPRWIMSKSSFTTTTTKPIDLYISDSHIFDWLADFAPALKDGTITIRAFPGSLFRFLLDIRQFQNHNRHDELLEDWL
jgi:hypothetical protein